MPDSPTGYHASRALVDQDGNIHLNGANLYIGTGSITDSSTVDITDALEGLADVETLTTTTAMAANGLSLIGTSTGAQTYTLGAPVVGARKRIVCVASTSTGLLHTVNSNSTAVTFQVAAASVALTFNAVDEAVDLIAATTLSWKIVGNVGSVGVTTQST